MTESDDRNNKWFLVSFATQLGFSMAVPLIIFIGGGIWLDKRFGTTPMLTLLGVLIGFLASAYSLYTSIKPYLRSSSGKKDTDTKKPKQNE